MSNAKQIFEKIEWNNYDESIKTLCNMANYEKWGDKNFILKRYVEHTFAKLSEENKIIETEDYILFNTGLYDKYYEEIYVYGTRKENRYKFDSYKTRYDLGCINISNVPQKADYFTNPSLLIFDWRLPVNIQYSHIMNDEENKKRLPEVIQNDPMGINKLKGSVEISIKRVIANYKLAVPQYYNGNIQLLLPLYITNSTTPDLALVISKFDGYYQGHTCLTMEMAYNNARLIAKPESNWLTI